MKNNTVTANIKRQVLLPEEYDISYFDGRKGPLKHNAGYDKYERWYRNDGANSLGEKWKDKAKQLLDKHSLKDKKVLEIGCAKGFLVKDLRDMGVDAYGLDVSFYAIDEAESGMSSYLTVGDARTYLSNYGDGEFDVVFSLRFLECVSEIDIPDLVDEMNRISKFQFHEVDEQPNSKYYLTKSANDYKSYSFAKDTVILGRESKTEVIK